MKQVSQELLDYLHSRTEFFICDLYEITLKSGLVFRYTTYDIDITLQDGRFFSCKGPYFKRSRLKLSSGISVDKLSITVYTDLNDKISNTPVMHVAHNGGFDEATLSLLKCFFYPVTDDGGNILLNYVETDEGVITLPKIHVVGAVEMFTGQINVDNGGGLGLKWSVKSGVQRLNVEYPMRKYYPTCPYSIYDASCGLNLASYTVSGAVTSVTSSQDFNTNLGQADGYFEQGGIEFITGELSGVSAPIKTSYQTGGRVVLLMPLGAAPAVGDTFNTYPGCDKTPTTCKNKFNNFSHNRATPYIPLKETIL